MKAQVSMMFTPRSFGKIGVEAYAAYALRAWLAGQRAVSPRTRRFAKWPAMLSFALGMAGQVTYHLLAGAGATRAPWAITTMVSCLPVLVLAIGTALAHMLRDDAAAARAAGDGQTALGTRSPGGRPHAGAGSRAGASPAEQARLVARRLAAARKPVSRRALRSGGIRGSNETLNKLARTLNAELADTAARART